MTLGSNYSDAVPKSGLEAAIAALPNKNLTVKVNTVDHNTFQENITTYLQNPDDVLSWFAGYRMRYFAAQDLLGETEPGALEDFHLDPEQTLYALHRADGARLAVLADRDSAFAAARAHELAPVSVH